MSRTPLGAAVAPAAFRAMMGRWATGVSVVTTHDGTVDAGLTVNALISVALEPPSLLVSLHRDIEALPVLRRSGTFAVNVLAAGQRPLAERFARSTSMEERFRGLSFHRGVTGAALPDGTLAALECRVVSATPAFDHVLVVGEVVRIEEGPDGPPLVFFRGGYAEAEGTDRLRLMRRVP